MEANNHWHFPKSLRDRRPAGRWRAMPASAQDLAEIRERGVIRHLGVPYARFITGNGEGFDADLVRRFAAQIDVRYEYVSTDWQSVIQDLIGQDVSTNRRPEHLASDRSAATSLPTDSRCQARTADRLLAADFPLGGLVAGSYRLQGEPIVPSGDLHKDIRRPRPSSVGNDARHGRLLP